MRARVVFLLASLTLTACRPTSPADLEAKVEVHPWPPRVGPAVVQVIPPKDLQVQTLTVTGDMTHAGMQPVIAEAREAKPGVWETQGFRFTMRGDWVLTVEATDANGRTYQQEVRLSVP